MNHELPRHWPRRPAPGGETRNVLFAITLLASLMLVLSACAGQPGTSNLPGSLKITSATVVTGLNYVLTGTFEFPDAEGGALEYSLNDGDWQQADLRSGSAFAVALTLREGPNKIAVAVITASGVRNQTDIVVTASTSGTDGAEEPDELGPEFLLTSAALSISQEYRLTGAVLDNVGIETASFKLNSAEPLELNPDSLGMFTVDLTLERGLNSISLAATDAAGNVGEADFEVTYIAQMEGVEVTPMVALAGESVTITGRNFGAEAGTVTLGDADALVDSWTDTEIVATVPAGLTGWLDLHVKGMDSEHTVPDFFAGVEVHDSAELNGWLTRSDGAGTALLLSGEDYTIGSSYEALFMFAGAYSLHGARTDGNPTTMLSSDSMAVYVITNPEFGIKFQDLRIEAQAVAFLNYAPGPATGISTSFPDGLNLENIEFTIPTPSVQQTAFAVGQIGNTDYAPVALRMARVHVTGVRQVMLESRNIHVQDSSFEFGTAMSVQSHDGPQRIMNTTMQSRDPSVASQLNLWSLDSVRVEKSDLTASVISLGTLQEGTYRDNEIATGTLQLATSVGMVVDNNRITLSGGLEIWSSDVTLTGNTITLVNGVSVQTAGQVNISGNDFQLDNYSPGTYAFSFTPQGGTLSVEFNGNSSSGINRLFRFAGHGGGIAAEVTGNTFTANLAAVGDVALLDSVTTAGAITTSDNLWGLLASAQDVVDLIHYTGGSTPGAMTVADF